MTAQATITRALNLARERLKAAPAFDIYQSIVLQLEYLEALLNGMETDRSKLKKIIVGHYGVREFEESDPEFADALIDAQAIASKMAKGLKV
jgi:hypothetical protein